MRTNSSKKLSKQFLETKFNYLYAHGRECEIESLILSASIPSDSKEILLWRYRDNLLIKQLGVLLQEKLNLAQPLSDRQVDRRLLKACDEFFDTLIAS